MIWRIRIALLTSVVMASALCSVWADDKAPDDKGKKEPAIDRRESIAPPMAAPAMTGGCGSPCAAPAMRTVCVTEWVPEYYKTTRTTYKTECVPERYTAYKTECVPEVRTRNVTHNERVCETHNVTKTVCERVCVQEARTVCKHNWTCVPETTYTCRTVDKGHYECREVACSEGLLSRFKGGLFGGHKHHHEECGCADACGSACGGCGDACATSCAPPTKTVKVWVSCKVTEQVPCTKMVRKCETIQVQEMVNVWKSVPKTVVCQETSWKCVPVCKTETYTAYTSRCVPYEATRMVSRCVPCTQEVTCCKMVARTVEKQVACETCSTASACDTCGATSGCCEKQGFGGRLRGMFSGMGKHHHKECGCESSCGSTCGSTSGGCSSCGH